MKKVDDYEIEVFEGLNNKLYKLWSKIEKQSLHSPFQSFDWIKNWYDTIGKPLYNILLQVVVIKKDNRLIAILPFSIRKVFNLSVLEWVGGVISDYHGPLISNYFRSNNSHPQIWSNIDTKLKNYDVAHFQKQNLSIVKFLKCIGFSSVTNHQLKSYNTDLFKNFDQFKLSIKKKVLSDIKRQKKRLSIKGDLDFLIAKDLNIKNIITNKMIAQKKIRYDETNIWNMFDFKEYKNFYNKILHKKGFENKLHVSALRIEKELISTHFGLVHKGIFYYLMPSYSTEWKKYSPGKVHLLLLIEWAIENKLNVFDFTVGGESYKKIWCKNENVLYESIKFINAKGYFYVNYIRLKKYLKNFAMMKYMNNLLNKFKK